MLVVDVGDLEHAPIRQPTRRHVRHIFGVDRDLARRTAARIDEQEILRGVVVHAHDQQLRAVRRPSPDHVPRGTGEERPLGAIPKVADDHIHVGRLASVGRERDLRAIGRRGVPREQSLHLARRIDGHRHLRSIGLADVELMQLGAASVRGREELTARAPAETANGVILDRHRASRRATGRRQRPRLVRTAALIRDDREREAIRRERDGRAACEAAGGVGYAGETLARLEIGQRTGHGPMVRNRH
jgi:hypothetical protein